MDNGPGEIKIWWIVLINVPWDTCFMDRCRLTICTQLVTRFGDWTFEYDKGVPEVSSIIDNNPNAWRTDYLEESSQNCCQSIWMQTFLLNAFNQNSEYKHRKNCESCQSQVTWKVKFKCRFCLSCPVLSCPCSPRPPWPWRPWWPWQVVSFMRKLEVVHKEVGGYLLSAQIDNHKPLTQSVSQLDLEV